MLRWLIAFLFTQCIEAPIYRMRLRSSWTQALLASTLTHPVVWFVIPKWTGFHPYWRMVLVCESFAVLGEWLWFKAIGYPKRVLSTSLFANAASVTLGLISRAFFGWP